MERFSKDSDEVLEFLKDFLSTTYSSSGTVGKGDFGKDEYESCAALIDPLVVFEHLKSIYGDSLDNVQSYPHDRGLSSEERTARQFAFVHAAVKKKSSMTP
jgi:hypothetical protein